MKRSIAIALIIFAYLFGVASPYVFNALSWRGGASIGGREMSRNTSPDGVLDAVVIEDDPRAMSSFIYYLYLFPKGETVRYGRTDPYIVKTSEGDELKTNLEKPHFLSVDAGKSHVQWFANLWYSDRVPNYYVELKLTTGPQTYLGPTGQLR